MFFNMSFINISNLTPSPYEFMHTIIKLVNEISSVNVKGSSFNSAF